MTTFIETLNHTGDHFLKFAWPMLWQSSLVIAVIFVLEFALRRNIRAAIRYALWLAVLVKLLLPPSLALPTSPAWWIHPSVPPPAKVPPVSFTVSYGEQMTPDFPLPPSPVIPPPRAPAMSFAAWTLAASGVVSAGLLAWLLVRWRQINQKVRRAKTSEKLIPVLDEARLLTRLHPGIRLKLTEDSMSPAVCGLFRPVILLPQSLVEKLSAEQLRAVLLHEAIHLRRGDVWVNCAQALLQIVYWWHPLLWLANARIRRVREEAVDDAVMLALRDDAEIYAPTLLEVAKLAFNRPLASLGLVGILESRSALHQRIERLVNFNAPKKAGLTIASILGILVFSAIALPMGEGPEKTNVPAASLQNNSPSLANAPKDVFIGRVDTNTVMETLSDSRSAADRTNTNPQATNLEMRTFQVNPHPFPANFLGLPTNSAFSVKNLSKKLFVDLAAPGRSVAYNVGTGLLMVRATPSELNTIERAVQALNGVPPQIHIKARFIEVEQDNNPARGFDWYLGSFSNGPVVANGRSAPTLAVPVSAANPPGRFPGGTVASQMPVVASNQPLTGILSSSNARITLHALESGHRPKLLAEPAWVTISGQETEVHSTVLQTILTNINPLALKPPGVSSNELFLTEQVECGPVFDVVPYVLAEGYTINLTATASVTEFLGYDKPTNSVTVYISGKKQTAPVPLPKFRTQKISTPANLWDGQTLVLGGPVTSATQTIKHKVPLLADLPLIGGWFQSQTENSVEKKLMVFVTATIVDPAGNRVHSDGELPFNPNTIPSQPQISSPSR